MKILLDTYVLLWALSEEPLLSGDMVYYLEDPDNICYFSTASLWEVALKHNAHERSFPLTAKHLFEICDSSEYYRLDIKPAHIIITDTLNYPENLKPHKDPFDRLLIAQAKAEGMKLLTHDTKLAAYNEDCVLLV